MSIIDDAQQNLFLIMTKMKEKYSRSTKCPTFQQLTQIITSIEFAYVQHRPLSKRKIETKIIMVIEDMLKYMSNCHDGETVESQVKDRLQLVNEIFVLLISKEKQVKGSFQTINWISNLSMKILRPIVLHVKLQDIKQLLFQFVLIKTTAETQSLKYTLCMQTLQLFFEQKHPKIEELLLSFSSFLLNTSNLNHFTNLFKLTGTTWFYIAGKTVRLMLEEYIEQFSKSYKPTEKFLYGKYDPKNIAMLIKTMQLDRHRVVIRRIKTFVDNQSCKQKENNIQNKENQQVSEIGQINEQNENAQHGPICNYCGSLNQNINMQKEYKHYLLEINNNIYNIDICKKCYQQFRNCMTHGQPRGSKNRIRKMSISDTSPFLSLNFFLLFYLFLNSEPPKTEPIVNDFSRLFNLTFFPPIIYLPCNKELKLVKQQILISAVAEYYSYGKYVNKIWRMLLIMANHNDRCIRIKTIESIQQICHQLRSIQTNYRNNNKQHQLQQMIDQQQQQQSKLLLSKLQKLMINRLLDMQQKVRISAISALVNMLPVQKLINITYPLFRQFYYATINLIGNNKSTRNENNKKSQKSKCQKYFIKQMKHLFQLICNKIKEYFKQETNNSNNEMLIISPSQFLQLLKLLIFILCSLLKLSHCFAPSNSNNQNTQMLIQCMGKSNKELKQLRAIIQKYIQICSDEQSDIYNKLLKQLVLPMNENNSPQQENKYIEIYQPQQEQLLHYAEHYYYSKQLYNILFYVFDDGKIYNAIDRIGIISEIGQYLARNRQIGIMENSKNCKNKNKIKDEIRKSQKYERSVNLCVQNELIVELIINECHGKIIHNLIHCIIQLSKNFNTSEKNYEQQQSSKSINGSSYGICMQKCKLMLRITNTMISKIEGNKNKEHSNDNDNSTMLHQISLYNNIDNWKQLWRCILNEIIPQEISNTFICEHNEKPYHQIYNNILAICYSPGLVLLLKIITNIDTLLQDSKPTLQLFTIYYKMMGNHMKRMQNSEISSDNLEEYRTLLLKAKLIMHFQVNLNENVIKEVKQKLLLMDSEMNGENGFEDLNRCVNMIVHHIQCRINITLKIHQKEEIDEIYLQCAKIFVVCWINSILKFKSEVWKENSDTIYKLIQHNNINITNLLMLCLKEGLENTKELYMLQKMRDIVIYMVNNIRNEEVQQKECDCNGKKEDNFFMVLKCEEFSRVINLLLSRGLVSIYHVQKIVLNGIVLSKQFNKSELIMCYNFAQLIIDLNKDPVNSRQLFSNFSQTVKFIFLMNQSQSSSSKEHSFYFKSDFLVAENQHPTILSKHEKTIENFKPTLIKTLCELLTKMVTNGKFVYPTIQNQYEISIISNTLMNCTKINLNQYKCVVLCLMSAVDYVFIQVCSLVKNNKSSQIQCGANLFQILKVLVYFLQGNPSQLVLTHPENYLKINIKQQIVQLEVMQKLKNNIEYGGLESLQSLHDSILCGYVSDEENSNQINESLSEESLYDTDSEQEGTNKTRKRITKKQKHYKVTKKNKISENIQSKSAPKFQRQSNASLKSIEEEQYFENVEYKNKLRSRQKMIL